MVLVQKMSFVVSRALTSVVVFPFVPQTFYYYLDDSRSMPPAALFVLFHLLLGP